jgi:protein-S-isoprenylcysteine O-methyltransferase Ste14
LETEDTSGPGVKFPPPVLTLAVIALAYGVDFIVEFPISQKPFWLTGGALVAIAGLIALIAVGKFFAAKTHIEPWKPTSAIIQGGIYRFSRNPIYLEFCIATLGIGLMLNSWWVVASTILLKFSLGRMVIDREEAYLEKKFGDEYLAYKNKVRRWV